MEQNIKDVVIDLVKLESKAKGWEDEWYKIYGAFSDGRSFLYERIRQYIYKNAESEVEPRFYELYTFFCNRLTLTDSKGLEIGARNITLDALFSEENIQYFLNHSEGSISELCIDQWVLENRKPGWEKEWDKICMVFEESHFLGSNIVKSAWLWKKFEREKGKKHQNEIKSELISEIMNDLLFYSAKRWKNSKASKKPATSRKTKISFLFSKNVIDLYGKNIFNDGDQENTPVIKKTFSEELQEAQRASLKVKVSDDATNDFIAQDVLPTQSLSATDEDGRNMCDILKNHRTPTGMFREDFFDGTDDSNENDSNDLSEIIETYYSDFSDRKAFTNEDIDFHAGIQLYPLYYSSSLKIGTGIEFLYKCTMSNVDAHARGEEENSDARLRRHLIIGLELLRENWEDWQEKEKSALRRGKELERGKERRLKKLYFNTFLSRFLPIFRKDSRRDLGFTEPDVEKVWSDSYNELLKKIFFGKYLPVSVQKKIVDELNSKEIPKIEDVKENYIKLFDKDEKNLDANEIL